MSKAYDKVCWSFLEEVMLKMRLDSKLVTLIMNCVKTVTFLVLINWEPHGINPPSRGNRQGDSLSPYLFLFCTKGSLLYSRGQLETWKYVV